MFAKMETSPFSRVLHPWGQLCIHVHPSLCRSRDSVPRAGISCEVQHASGDGGKVWEEWGLQGAELWLPMGEMLCDLWGSAANTEIKRSALNGP